MKNQYSSISSSEEKKNIKKATKLIVLTILIGIFILFVGVPVSTRIATFFSDLKSSSSPISQKDTTPPAPPNFDPMPDATNQQSVKIVGNAEAGASIKLTVNGDSINVPVGKDGKFSYNFSLKQGDNNVSGITVDPSGNKSQESKKYTIVFDNKAPDLDISFPSDGLQRYGASQRQLTIKGNTEAEDNLTINERIVSVDDSGNFQYTLSLMDGENKFTIKSEDQAGNSTQKELTVIFNP